VQLRQRTLVRLVRDMQKNIDSILDLKELVVGEMLADRKVGVCYKQVVSLYSSTFTMVRRHAEEYQQHTRPQRAGGGRDAG
jgi:hypothetical protein